MKGAAKGAGREQFESKREVCGIGSARRMRRLTQRASGPRSTDEHERAREND